MHSLRNPCLADGREIGAEPRSRACPAAAFQQREQLAAPAPPIPSVRPPDPPAARGRARSPAVPRRPVVAAGSASRATPDAAASPPLFRSPVRLCHQSRWRPVPVPEVEDMAPVTDPGPMGRQRWPVAGSTAQATSGAQPPWRCRSSVQPLQRWVVPIGEGPLWGGEQLCRPQATAAAVERVTRRKGCASRPGGRPLRSGGWVFLAAAGGCGIGFWIARRPARGCGGRGRLGPGVGGRWVAEAPRPG